MPGARAALFAREGAKPMPAWSNWQTGLVASTSSVANGGTTTLTFSTGIPCAAGDLIVVKATSGTSTLYPSAMTYTGGGGGTAIRTGVNYAAASYCPATFFVCVATAAGTIIPTITFTASGSITGTTIWAIAERWPNARYDSAAAFTGVAVPSGTAASTTITPTNPASAITFLAADFTATSPGGTIAMMGTAVQTGTSYLNGTILGATSGWLPAREVAPQTFGLTDTVAQKNYLAALEIKPIAA